MAGQDWSIRIEPDGDTFVFNPSQQNAENSDMISWNNRSDDTLRFGPSALDEMCNLNGYFFRDVDLPREARTGVGGDLMPVVP